jgi:acyl-CoA dehydrogenase
MRTIGVVERAMELMLMEATNTKKKPFGKMKGEHGKIQWEISKSRIELEMCRRLVYHAAQAMDQRGYKGAIREIAMAKIAIPHMACDVGFWLVFFVFDLPAETDCLPLLN